jgi:hypothetical protein
VKNPAVRQNGALAPATVSDVGATHKTISDIRARACNLITTDDLVQHGSYTVWQRIAVSEEMEPRLGFA